MQLQRILFNRFALAVLLSFSATFSAFAQVGISDNLLGIAPQSILHVHSNTATGNLLQLTNNVSGNTMSYHGFAVKADPDFKVIFANQYGHVNAGMGFTTNIMGSQFERMTILNNGNVGIGVVNPVHRLTVGGTLGLLETGVSPALFTTLQSGDLSGALTFTLPNSYGTSGQALVSDGAGNLSWSNRETPLTFSNGITRSGSAVKLGGALTENTTITQSGTQTLNFLNSGSGNTVFNLTGTGNFDLQASGTSMLFGSAGNIGIGTTTPTGKLAVAGDVIVNYPGGGNALNINGSSQFALGYVANANAGTCWGLSAGCVSPSAGVGSYGLMGFNYGSGYGVYGKTNDGFGTYGTNLTSFAYGYFGGPEYGTYGNNGAGNYGFLGGDFYAVYGSNTAGHTGYIGGADFGVRGNHASGNYGYLGGTSNGVYGYLGSTAVGQYALYGYGPHANGVNGTGYSNVSSLGGVQGYCFWGNPYTFGVSGFSYLDNGRSGSVFGGNVGGTIWGSLAYNSASGGIYGGYFTTSTTGAGKAPAQVLINSGIAAWGDLFGADIHGKVYGIYAEGSDYAAYNNGNEYNNGLDIHLQKEASGSNTVLYTHVSTDVTVQTCGVATLSAGSCDVTFDPSFAAAVSASSPVVVTVTPMGNSGGVFLSEVSAGGFKIRENNDGKSTVQVSYIAIGKRAGYEKPVLPPDVIAGDYVEKLARGLHNDNDRSSDGEGLYYENGRLQTGRHPSTLPDPNKPAVDPQLARMGQSESVKPQRSSGATPANSGTGAAPAKPQPAR